MRPLTFLRLGGINRPAMRRESLFRIDGLSNRNTVNGRMLGSALYPVSVRLSAASLRASPSHFLVEYTSAWLTRYRRLTGALSIMQALPSP